MRVPALSPVAGVLVTTASLMAATLGLVAPASAVEPEVYPAPADGVFRMQGSGWGHGRGMSQWGAYQAASVGVAHPQILAFYYPGTVLTAMPESQVRVLIESSDGVEQWRTVGSSTNIIEASWLALADSMEYWLIKNPKN